MDKEYDKAVKESNEQLVDGIITKREYLQQVRWAKRRLSNKPVFIKRR